MHSSYTNMSSKAAAAAGTSTSRNSLFLMAATAASLLFVVTYHFYVERSAVVVTEASYWQVQEIVDDTSAMAAATGVDNNRDSVAVLITGQCHRFVYRDQLPKDGPMFTFQQAPKLSKYRVDVYIVLQCGEKQQPLIGNGNLIETPPYSADAVNVTDIEQWYLQQGGADSVHITLLTDIELDAKYEAITQSAMNVYGDYYEFKLSWMIGTPRWGMEVRKFYLRHLAFTTALASKAAMAMALSSSMPTSASSRRYSAYVYWRDDNFFYAPLDLDNLYFDKHKPSEDPFLVVDKHCENEAFSDKIYITNHQGAALLFSSTMPEFMAWMKRYLLFGFFQKERKEETLSPEKFVHDTIGNADVDRADLSRVDVRYVNGALCVPDVYFQCMPFATKKYLTAEHNLKPCV